MKQSERPRSALRQSRRRSRGRASSGEPGTRAHCFRGRTRALGQYPNSVWPVCVTGSKSRGIRFDVRRVSYCASYEADAGCQFASEVLKAHFDFTALVTGNDALALGFMRIAQQHGIRIPERLSVAGFDNIPEGALLWPGLTRSLSPRAIWAGGLPEAF